MEVIIPLITLGGIAMAQRDSKKRQREEAFQQQQFMTERPAECHNLSPQPADLPYYVNQHPTNDVKYPHTKKNPIHHSAAHLDRAIGTGSLFTHKKEHANMFPSHPTDQGDVSEQTRLLERDRTDEAISNNNRQSGVRPFQPLHTRGDLPDHLMERIPEPTVDDLRSRARPKPDGMLAGGGYMGMPKSIQVPASMPEHMMTKTTPDTFYENMVEFWTGKKSAINGESSYSTQIHLDRPTARQEYAATEYAGQATGTAHYAPAATYEPSTRQDPSMMPVGQASRGGVGGYVAPTSGHRPVAPRLKTTPLMAVAGALGSFVAPVWDLVRDKRMSDESSRPVISAHGGRTSAIPQGPSSGPAPTKREMMVESNRTLLPNATGVNMGTPGYLIENASMKVGPTERSRSVQETYFGIGGGAGTLVGNPYSSMPANSNLRNLVDTTTDLRARMPSGRGNCIDRPDVSGGYRSDKSEDTRQPAPHGRCELPSLSDMGQQRLRPDASLSSRLPDPSLIITEDVRRNPLLIPHGSIW